MLAGNCHWDRVSTLGCSQPRHCFLQALASRTCRGRRTWPSPGATGPATGFLPSVLETCARPLGAGRPEQPQPSSVRASGSAPSDALLPRSPLPSPVLAQPRPSEALAPPPPLTRAAAVPAVPLLRVVSHGNASGTLSTSSPFCDSLKPTYQACPLPYLCHLPKLECGKRKKASAQIDISIPARSFESDRL